MYSTISDDLTRDYLSLESANGIKKIFENTKSIAALHKELLEFNLSITAYIEESNSRLKSFKLGLVHEARNSHKVVQILSENCKGTNFTMSDTSKIASKKKFENFTLECNNNKNYTPQRKAQAFINWYKQIVDNDRQNLTLYLSEDCILEWFGRTIKSRKKVSMFLKYDMQCTRHDFISIKSVNEITLRFSEKSQRIDDKKLASPLQSPILLNNKKENCKKRLRSCNSSPDWAEGHRPAEQEAPVTKKNKTINKSTETLNKVETNWEIPNKKTSEISHKGDGIIEKHSKRKCVVATPPNLELGQGDCKPSTSTDSNSSHDALNLQLPRLFVECNGYIEFTRTRNNRSADSMKWQRKCKTQISYSEDPLNIGEYVVWVLHYSDESKCRRNLLPAFEEVAKEEGLS